METRLVQNEINKLQETEIDKQIEELKAEVSRHIAYLEHVKKDTMHRSLEQIQDEALSYLESIRFGK
ncbi:MAG: hypothetical protein MUP82_03170, partial [Candidatus Marinimicrobia bacterium]|nr:hypothetical protein [Candidatus Neomarinimicrobiota bacterium]